MCLFVFVLRVAATREGRRQLKRRGSERDLHRGRTSERASAVSSQPVLPFALLLVLLRSCRLIDRSPVRSLHSSLLASCSREREERSSGVAGRSGGEARTLADAERSIDTNPRQQRSQRAARRQPGGKRTLSQSLRETLRSGGPVREEYMQHHSSSCLSNHRSRYSPIPWSNHEYVSSSAHMSTGQQQAPTTFCSRLLSSSWAMYRPHSSSNKLSC